MVIRYKLIKRFSVNLKWFIGKRMMKTKLRENNGKWFIEKIRKFAHLFSAELLIIPIQ